MVGKRYNITVGNPNTITVGKRYNITVNNPNTITVGNPDFTYLSSDISRL